MQGYVRYAITAQSLNFIKKFTKWGIATTIPHFFVHSLDVKRLIKCVLWFWHENYLYISTSIYELLN